RVIPSASRPKLIARANATPLLLYYQQHTGSPLMATLLDDALESSWTTEVLDSTYGDGFNSGVFMGDAFLVAERRSGNTSDPGGVRVARLELDGQLGLLSMPGSSSTEYPTLSWHGSAARLVWVDFGSGRQMFIASLDAQGRRVGNAVLVPNGGDYFNKAQTMAAGSSDLFILMSGYTGGTGIASHLAFALHNAILVRKSGPTLLTESPNTLTSYQLKPMDGRGVAAWVESTDPPRLGLALLNP
ncbi:MAG: hypothetical protein JRH20_22385, partial [Deltaproteobacteria bacterium]|nr:hypothetical protein [Deltaproteobacteria bacterium]